MFRLFITPTTLLLCNADLRAVEHSFRYLHLLLLNSPVLKLITRASLRSAFLMG